MTDRTHSVRLGTQRGSLSGRTLESCNCQSHGSYSSGEDLGEAVVLQEQAVVRGPHP